MHLSFSPPLETGRASRLMRKQLPPHQLGLRRGSWWEEQWDDVISSVVVKRRRVCGKEQVSPESNQAHSRRSQLFHPKTQLLLPPPRRMQLRLERGCRAASSRIPPSPPNQINHPAENQRLHAKINGSTEVGQGSFFPDGVQVLDRGSLGKRWEERQLVVCGSGSVWETGVGAEGKS